MSFNFEDALKENEKIVSQETEVNPNEHIKIPHLKSEKSATLYDFIKMVDKIVTLTMKDKNVKFMPYEERIVSLDAMAKFDYPFITYEVTSKEPKDELKPRERETITHTDENGEVALGSVAGQRFKCAVQFTIIAKDYDDAENLLNEFEDLMVKYTGYFKRNGVAEIIYGKQIKDTSMARLREIFSVRNLYYYVEIEKTTVIFKQKIREISLILDKQIKEDL